MVSKTADLSSLSGAVFADSGSAANSALPDATAALFGNEGFSADALSALGSGIPSGAGESVSSVLPSATDALFGAASGGALDAVGDVAGSVASSAGEGVLDLVGDGIGSLLGALFD